MFPPNILITNFCNQNCSFCFANKEMNDKSIKKEISINDFKGIISKLKKDPTIKVIKIMGGEPTLHSKFKEIINLALKHFSYIQIFTNGIISEDLTNFLIEKTPKVRFTFNIMTPGFLFNPKIRYIISQRLYQLVKLTRITLSFTFDMNTDMEIIFKALDDQILSSVHHFRLGFANPIARQKKFYRFSDFPKMGKQLFYVVSKIRRYNKNAAISLNCGFTRCMFSRSEFNYLKKEINISGFGCFGKDSSFDIQTNMSAFHCFPLSTMDKISTRKRSFKNVNRYLLYKRFFYWSKIKRNVCLKCPFYGFGKNKCPGPCLGFLIV